MTDWKVYKTQAENAFKQEHKTELYNVHKDGVTGFPVKFDLGLSPILKNLESARKNKKATEVSKYIAKGIEVVGKYQKRIDDNKKELGGAYTHLNSGLAAVRALLK